MINSYPVVLHALNSNHFLLMQNPIHQILSCLLIAVLGLGKCKIAEKVEQILEDHSYVVEALNAGFQGDGSACFDCCFGDLNFWRKWWARL